MTTSKLLVTALVVISSLTAASGCTTLNELRHPPKPLVDLQLNRDWRCAQEGSDTICKPVSAQSELEKVIIWSAKEKSDQDTLAAYRTHLGSVMKRKFHFKQIASTPVSAQTITLNGREWVDAVQLNSEIPGYNTRYLATATDKLAILITFSARTRNFEDFQKEIQPLIEQLKLD